MYRGQAFALCDNCGAWFSEHNPEEIEPDVFMPTVCYPTACESYYPCYEDYEGPRLTPSDELDDFEFHYGPFMRTLFADKPQCYCGQCALMENLRQEGVLT